MTLARAQLVPNDEDGDYHCISRCVRRAYLCGYDQITGKSFDYRRLIIQDRIRFLTEVFTIKPLAFALMHNHCHLLLRVTRVLQHKLSEEEVASRWLTLYPKRRTKDGKAKIPNARELAEITNDKKRLKVLRERLGSISWFMKSLNEYVAKIANKEDNCKGRFWEGRFKSQKVQDDAGLLACSIYVDLNPVRAKIAKTPETSEYTSAYERIKSLKAREKLKAVKTHSSDKLNSGEIKALKTQAQTDSWLSPISRTDKESYLDLNLEEYLELLDWTGRQIRQDKRGSIPDHLSSILIRLKIKEENWLDTCEQYGRKFFLVTGAYENLKSLSQKVGRRWFKGQNAAKLAFN